MYKIALLLLVCGLHSPDGVDAHGRLIDPPSRSSMWRYNFDNPPNYNDNQLFCGGVAVQYGQNGGKCGLCGDPYNGERENEAGGKYANGIIVGEYAKGSVLKVKIDITAFHKGWSEFRLCKNDDVTKRITEECLNKTLLPLAKDKNIDRIMMTGKGITEIQLRLPPDLTCTQCVLQWKYHTGNSWGYPPGGGKGCVGCGDQEEFYGCSDITIYDTVTLETPSPRPTTTTTTPAKKTTTTTQRTPSWYPKASTTSPTTSTSGGTPVTSSPTLNGKVCMKVAGSPATDQWCNINCNHVPPYCPTSHCICIDSKRSMPHNKGSDAAEDRVRSMPHHEDSDAVEDSLRSMPHHKDRGTVEDKYDDEEAVEKRIITLLESILSRPYRQQKEN